MDMRKAYAIAIKDLTEVFTSPSIYGPMLGVPIFFSLVLPVLTFYVTRYSASTIAARIASLPLVSSSGPPGGIMFMAFFSVSVLGPIFLTMPILTSSVIAADSFAGEKERKTSESLLSTPVSTSELLLGKVMASLIPTILLTLVIFGLYGTATNWLAYSAFKQNILPTPVWLMMLLAAPFLAIATIGIVVLVSSHVKGIKESQQISTLLILPILVMPFASITGLASLSIAFFTWLIGILVVADAIILYLGVKTFKKDNIL